VLHVKRNTGPQSQKVVKSFHNLPTEEGESALLICVPGVIDA
jgi:hypothetical protein